MTNSICANVVDSIKSLLYLPTSRVLHPEGSCQQNQSSVIIFLGLETCLNFVIILNRYQFRFHTGSWFDSLGYLKIEILLIG